MNSISITFAHPHLFFLLIPAFAIIIIPFFLISKVRRRTFRKIMPVILHCLIAVLIVLIASKAQFVTKTSEEVTALLLDLSYSTGSVRDKLLSDAGQLEEIIKETSPVSVVIFAENEIKAGSTANIASILEEPELLADATNIADAIEYTVSILPKNKPKRIILLSDGRETDGKAAKTAEFHSNLGVQIDSVFYDTSEVTEPEVQINAVSGNKNIFLGDEVHFMVEVESNVQTDARFIISDNDRVATGNTFDIVPGTQVFEFTTVPITAGTHKFTIKMNPGVGTDTSPVNNKSYYSVDVTGTSKVLIIANKKATGTRLKILLEGEKAVDLVSPDELPKSLAELAAYDEIILSNIDYNTLPDGYGDMLKKYVSDYGRSLLTVGGTDTFMLGNMEGTVLEEMMPVSFALTEDETDRAVALMLVIDTSMSMSMNRSPNMSMAKEGAIGCLEAMSSADYVGVINFSRSANVRSPLKAATDSNKQYLTRIISSLNTSSGTYYTEALELAYRELKKSPAPVKHVMFLSDGQPNDRDYLDVVEQMAEDGITVSTIGLGYSSSQLKAISTAGNGRYYYVPNATDLPNIMLSEAEQITIDSLRLGSFKSVINGHDPLTEGLNEEDIPTLSGYIATKLKDEAAAPLISDEGYPIFAKHTYGNGIVATFTSDLSANWTSRWFLNFNAIELIENLVDSILPEEHLESYLDVSYEVYGKTAKVTIVSNDSLEGKKLLITALDTTQAEYDFTKNSVGNYEATVKVNTDDVNNFSITVTDDKGDLTDFASVHIPVGYSAEYRKFVTSGQNTMATVSRVSGGTMLVADKDNLLSLTVPTGRTLEYVTDLVVPFAITALILLLLDIIIRKLRWKDIARFFRKK